MCVNNLPKTITGQPGGCDLNPGPTAPESSTLTTRLPSDAEEARETDAIKFVGACQVRVGRQTSYDE